MNKTKTILLVIGGGIAAYKSLELIRGLKKRGLNVRAILTDGGAQFITPLSVSSLTGEKTYTNLFSLTDEEEMGHIQLTREADLIIIAPATADLMAKMANGLANDLASTALLANKSPLMLCPAMNVEMWNKSSTQNNVESLQKEGAIIIDPEEGDMACGEYGPGRLAEVDTILSKVDSFFLNKPNPLTGKKILITAGPTIEALDPVRYIANRSSGKQGYAIAQSLFQLGADITLVSGPTGLPKPQGIKVIGVESADEMLKACKKALPSDVIICVAAVSDWKSSSPATEKIKKTSKGLPEIKLQENPDILKELSKNKTEGTNLIIGFAAETENLIENAKTKRQKKGCDWIVANDVSSGTDVMGGENNKVFLVTKDNVEDWPKALKTDVANLLADRIVDHFKDKSNDK